ncbi:MAG: glycosyltransferase [Candidatus Omnitrophica bacterium]|nr:glycosyltransferase [Candidatus Omnitrophota bacterium]
MSKNLAGKKILVLLAGFLENDSRVRRHILFLRDQGFAITLMSFDENPASGLPAIEYLKWPGFDRVKKQARFWSGSKGPLFYILKLVSIFYFNVLAFWAIKNRRFDFYLANDFDTLSAVCWTARRPHEKVIYDSHELFAEQRLNTPRFYIRLIQFWEKKLLGSVDSVVTVNNSIACELVRRHSLNRKPAVILNVPEISEFISHAHKQPNSVLFHGNLSRGRGLKELVLAMTHLPKVQLVLRGRGDMEDELRQLVKTHGLSDRIQFESPVAVNCVIPEAEKFEMGVVFLEPDCPNNELGLPNKIFEYLHAGLAILSNSAVEIKTLLDKERDRYHFGKEREKWRLVFESLSEREDQKLCAVSQAHI